MPTHTFQDRKPERELLPKGKHLLTVKEWESKVAKKSGNEMIELKVKGDGGGAFFDRLVFTADAEWRIDQFLLAIGKAPPKGQAVDFNDELLSNARFWAMVDIQDYEDANKVKRQKNVITEYLHGEPIPPLPEEHASTDFE